MFFRFLDYTPLKTLTFLSKTKLFCTFANEQNKRYESNRHNTFTFPLFNNLTMSGEGIQHHHFDKQKSDS